MYSRKGQLITQARAVRYFVRGVGVRLRIYHNPSQCQSRPQTPLNEPTYNFLVAALGYGRLQQPSLRKILRSATSEVYARVHNQHGLEAVRAGKTGRADCIGLPRRFYGFHRRFEVAAGIAIERTDWWKRIWVYSVLDRGGVTSSKSIRPRRSGFHPPARRFAWHWRGVDCSSMDTA